ncbi:hypothetical protein D5086_007045 [Populus alba]|uniref:Uncharacterized protein n=1 Tax=Populus alba TaxID=43335 RepID=A0ACC4CNS0_POPAL
MDKLVKLSVAKVDIMIVALQKGSIDFVGADPLMNKTRDISVIGGTGDFFMTRGIATLMADAFQGEFYFRLRV